MKYKKTLASIMALSSISSIAVIATACNTSYANTIVNNEDSENNFINIKPGDDNDSINTFDPVNNFDVQEVSLFKSNIEKEIKKISNTTEENEINKNFEQLVQSLQKVNYAMNARNEIVNELKRKVSNNEITLKQAIDTLNENIANKYWTTSNWATIMNITKERFISAARYTKSMKESNIKANASQQIGQVWLYLPTNEQDVNAYKQLKFYNFVDTFAYLDLIDELKTELLTLPYYYENVHKRSMYDVMKDLEGNDVYFNAIIKLYKTWKEISIIDECMDWYSISPSTTNSYWYKWIQATKETFNESFKVSGIVLDGDASGNKPGDWDGKVAKKLDSKYSASLLPASIDKNNVEEVDNYIFEQIVKIEQNRLTNDEIKKLLDEVFYRIVYYVEDNAYKNNFALLDINYETNKTKVLESFNNSLYNKNFSIKNFNEILSAKLDKQKIDASRFINAEAINGSGSLTPEEVINDLKVIEKTFYKFESISNIHKINLFNQTIRNFDLFNEIYYELSIFPFLFSKYSGKNLIYSEWLATFNSSSINHDEKLLPYKKDWMTEQYLTFRDWKLYKEKYLDNLKYESIKYLSKETLDSNWYQWLNKINFQDSFKKYSI